ncbi:hypothetical protein O181_033573 [Austropuccinia psidii MF-1]|uniref:Uncharacterized protein n=1 Tax=Austropuccinia psidii MF-1 TaxID=1389203 RepID=A0A9Q3D3U0_9BASI|nr:hypothetical protein [Austropuccinia psidii MF-1]
MRQDHGKHSRTLWKEQITFKWENDYWRFKKENSFEEEIVNIERERPMSWFPQQKYRLTSLHPDMADTMLHKRILRKGSGDLENAIRRRLIETFHTEDYINYMEYSTTRNKIGRNWNKPPIENKTCEKPISRPL